MEKQSRRVASLSLRGCDITKSDRPSGEARRLGDSLRFGADKTPDSLISTTDGTSESVAGQWDEYLSKITDPSVLKCPSEPPPGVDLDYHDHKMLASVDLATMREYIERREVARDYNEISISDQYKEYPEGDAMAPGSELLVNVVLYSRKNLSKELEIEVLGTQTLADIRDQLYCLSDLQLTAHAGDSALMFIEGAFFDDMRDPQNTRLSRKYIDELRGSAGDKYEGAMGKGVVHEMKDMAVADLVVRMGVPYVYLHRTDCEHILLFAKARILHLGDPLSRSAYPRRLFKAKVRRQRCRICDIFFSKYVTYNDERAPEGFAFLCEECSAYLHHDYEPGPNFEIHNYYHD